MLPQAVADQLVNRDITEADFELLMQLDKYVHISVHFFKT
jgi:hypothetical protein